MTNCSSPALLNFFGNLREVGTLISLSKSKEVTAKSREINECLSRASTLLLCSHIESFFEDLIVDIIDFHENNQTAVMMLPIKLRVIQTVRKPLSDSLSPEKKWKIIESISQNLFTDDTNKCQLGMFDAALHLKGFASPGSGAVENLFDGIGMSNIWSLVEQINTNTNSRRSLDAFVSRRNSITHGASADKPTIADVKIYIYDLCEIVRIFDSIVGRYLADDFNIKDPWLIIS
jgi:RiboL-PSP-HEPN